ncbi:Uncharacterized conserved protein, contains Zn finger domain, partial [Streptomyces sp. di188]
SMAAPARDGDHRRTFPPCPPRPSGDGDSFAETWWGRAWVTALEDGALDPARLARGRGYAEQGHVDAITVTPGLVLAYVQGSRPRPYRVQVRLRTFDEADWDRFLDAAADRPGHIAALLDKEMPQSLADGGVPLLPGPGDLAPRCSCPDSGHPCKHAAALCYQTARLLDADPFVLLLLRGRGEREVIDALSRLSAARAARAAQGREPEQLPGIRATDAVFRRGPEIPPLPAPLPPPSHPEQPPGHPASPGGPDPFALDQLATDAAARAHALLTTGRDPVGPLSLWHDAVRLAAARPGSGLTAGTRALYVSLARAAGRTPGDLARAVAAWRQGGPTGLSVLEEPWDPPAGRFDRARPLLLAADLPAFRPWRNRITHPRGHVQLRLGRDHLWYAYESEPDQDDWWPRGTPDPTRSEPSPAWTPSATPDTRHPVPAGRRAPGCQPATPRISSAVRPSAGKNVSTAISSRVSTPSATPDTRHPVPAGRRAPGCQPATPRISSAVRPSAGKNVSTAISSRVTSRGDPKTVVVQSSAGSPYSDARRSELGHVGAPRISGIAAFLDRAPEGFGPTAHDGHDPAARGRRARRPTPPRPRAPTAPARPPAAARRGVRSARPAVP